MMWRKSEDAKSSSSGSKSSEPVAATSKQNQTTISSVSTPEVSSTPSTSPSLTASPVTPSPAAAAPVTPSLAPLSVASPGPTSSSAIGAGLKIRGDVSGNSNLVIEGEVQGKVQMINGRVTVAANGRVNADIEALEISIDGRVDGNLKATESVRLGATSHVQGSILTRRIAIEDGAGLRGKVEMIRGNDSANSSSAGATAETKTTPKAIAASSPGK